MAKRQTGQFLVETEEGETINVFEFTDFIAAESPGDEMSKEQEVIKEYRTADGRILNRLQKDIFEIAETGQRAMRAA